MNREGRWKGQALSALLMSANDRLLGSLNPFLFNLPVLGKSEEEDFNYTRSQKQKEHRLI